MVAWAARKHDLEIVVQTFDPQSSWLAR